MGNNPFRNETKHTNWCWTALVTKSKYDYVYLSELYGQANTSLYTEKNKMINK